MMRVRFRHRRDRDARERCVQIARPARAASAAGIAGAIDAVVGALLTALPGMASIIGLMALVPVGVLATKLFGAIAPSSALSAPRSSRYSGDDGRVARHRAWRRRSPGGSSSYLLIATFMVLNLFIAVVVNAMQSHVTEDLKGEGEPQQLMA
jgi:voltage-gated sodium channel